MKNLATHLQFAKDYVNKTDSCLKNVIGMVENNS